MDIVRVFISLGAISVFAAADILSKKWGDTNQVKWILLACLIGPAGWIGFGLLGRVMPLAAVSGMVNLGVVLVPTLWGIFVLKESLSPMQWSATILGIVAIGLFTMAESAK